MASGGWVMTVEQDLRLRVIGDFREGKTSREEAATLLGVNWRTVTRWAKRVRTHGPGGILHGNHAKTPPNKASESERQAALALYQERYFDFNMLHAHEKLVTLHGLTVSYSTWRTWCRQAGLGKKRRRRASKARLARERLANRGLLLQMDGSDHAWNGSSKWTLIGAIDDATSELPGIGFFDSECTWSCLAVLRRIVEGAGIPVALYVDQANWYGGLRAESRTQFSRACAELGIKLIAALSPQAKGRIERTWRTFQDRLIPELRLAGIRTMTEANQYLADVFLPAYWQPRNTVEPREEESRYRRPPGNDALEQIFCLKHERTVTRGQTIHFDNVVYRLKTPFVGSISGQRVTIHEYKDGTWAVYLGAVKLEARRHLTPERRKWQRAS